MTSPRGIPFRVILGRREASKEYTDYGSTHFLQPLDEVGKIVKQQEYNLGVSKNRGFYMFLPQIIHFNRIFHYKPSILGAHPYFWKHSSECNLNFEQLLQRHSD